MFQMGGYLCGHAQSGSTRPAIPVPETWTPSRVPVQACRPSRLQRGTPARVPARRHRRCGSATGAPREPAASGKSPRGMCSASAGGTRR